jgi:serine/threonine protein kinase
MAPYKSREALSLPRKGTFLAPLEISSPSAFQETEILSPMREHLKEGTCLHGRYTVVRLLGEGGMGAVYLCEDLEVKGKTWALKEMCLKYAPSFFQEQAVNQFKREVQILATLNHPNLPHISHFFQHEENYFLVMEYVEGQNLAQVLQERRGMVKEHEAVSWALQICEVLDYLHSQPQPIIYRDLKPSNIMLTPRGQVKLIDFGIARFFDPCKVTDTFKMGSVGFSPPEQYRGKGSTDSRSDIYSLGATMHFLLTNRDPQDEAPFSFPPPRTLNPGLSPKIDRIVVKALEYKKEKRFSSIAEMKKALEEEEGVLWNNPLTRKFLTSPRFAMFLENPAAQREKVAILVILLCILAATIIVDAVKIYSLHEHNRKKGLSQLHYVRGQFMLEKGLLADALGEFNQALLFDKDDVRSQFCTGLIYERMEDYDRASEAFEKTLKIDRGFYLALRERGIVQFRKKNYDEALRSISAALDKDPEDGLSHYYFAMVLEAQGKKKEALHEYETYLKILPRAPERSDVEAKIKALSGAGN